MSKPNAKKKTGAIAPVQKAVASQPAATHVALLLADAQKMHDMLGEVPCKFGVAWMIDTLQKAPSIRINEIHPDSPAKKPASPS